MATPKTNQSKRNSAIMDIDNLWWELLKENMQDPELRKNTAFMNVVRQALKDQQVEISGEVPKDSPMADVLKNLQDRGLPVFDSSGRPAVFN